MMTNSTDEDLLVSYLHRHGSAPTLLTFVCAATAMWSPSAVAASVSSGDPVQLASAHDTFLSALDGANAFQVNTEAELPHVWETFRFVHGNGSGDNTPIYFGQEVGVRSVHDRFLLGAPNGDVHADPTVMGAWERWRLVDPDQPDSSAAVQCGSKVAFRNHHSDNYLTGTHLGEALAEASVLHSWEQWTLLCPNVATSPGTPTSFAIDQIKLQVVDGTVQRLANGYLLQGEIAIGTNVNGPFEFESIELAHASLRLTFAEGSGTRIDTIVGSGRLTPPEFGMFDALEIADPLEVTFGLDWGEDLEQFVEAPVQDDRRYLVFHAAAGLSAELGPLALEAPVGQSMTLVYDPSDPFMYFKTSIEGLDALGKIEDVGLGFSMNGHIPFEPETTWGQDQEFVSGIDGHMYISGSVSMAAIPLSFHGELVVDLDPQNDGITPLNRAPLNTGDTLSLRSHCDKYLVVLPESHGSRVSATASAIGPWERFTVLDVWGNSSQVPMRFGHVISLRTNHDGLLGRGPDHGATGSATEVGAWERWELVDARHPGRQGFVRCGSQVALKNAHSHKYLVAESNGEVNANRDGLASFETWTIDCGAGEAGIGFGFNGSAELDIELHEGANLVLPLASASAIVTTGADQPSAKISGEAGWDGLRVRVAGTVSPSQVRVMGEAEIVLPLKGDRQVNRQVSYVENVAKCGYDFVLGNACSLDRLTWCGDRPCCKTPSSCTLTELVTERDYNFGQFEGKLSLRIDDDNGLSASMQGKFIDTNGHETNLGGGRVYQAGGELKGCISVPNTDQEVCGTLTTR